MKKVKIVLMPIFIFFLAIWIGGSDMPSQGIVQGAMANGVSSDSTGFVTQPYINPLNQKAASMNALGERLWFAGAETGDLSEWDGTTQMNSNNTLFFGTSTDASISGKRSFKIQVDAGGKMASSQMFIWSPNNVIMQNTEIIQTAWYYIPQKIDFYGVSWHNIWQWKGRTTNCNGSNCMSRPIFTMGLNVRGGKGSGGENFIQLRNTREHWGNNASFNYSQINTINIPLDRFFKITVRFKRGRNNDGEIHVWQDDVKIYEVLNVTTFPLNHIDGWDVTQVSWSLNNYTQNTTPAITTVYIDDASIHLPGNTEDVPASIYILTLEHNPSYGGAVQNLTGGDNYQEGDQVRLRATPNQGYAFLNWMQDGQVIGSNPEINITMPGANTTLIANFEKVVEESEPVVPVNNSDSNEGEFQKFISGLVAFYEMDKNERNKLLDSHGDNHGDNFEVINTKAFINNGNEYNGENAKSIVPHKNSLNLEYEFTIMADVLRTGNGQDNSSIIIGKTFRDQWRTAQDYSVALTADNKIRIRTHSGSLRDWVSEKEVPHNKWVRIIATYKSGEGYQLFLDSAVPEKSNSISGNISKSGLELSIGSATVDQSAAEERRFRGILDNVGLWNRKLNDTEIKSLILEKITYPDFLNGTGSFNVNLKASPANAGQVSIKVGN
jgi:hypothetical protein